MGKYDKKQCEKDLPRLGIVLRDGIVCCQHRHSRPALGFEMTVVQRERQHGCSHFETVQRAELIGSELLRGHSSHHSDTCCCVPNGQKLQVTHHIWNTPTPAAAHHMFALHLSLIMKI